MAKLGDKSKEKLSKGQGDAKPDVAARPVEAAPVVGEPSVEATITQIPEPTESTATAPNVVVAPAKKPEFYKIRKADFDELLVALIRNRTRNVTGGAMIVQVMKMFDFKEYSGAEEFCSNILNEYAG